MIELHSKSTHSRKCILFIRKMPNRRESKKSLKLVSTWSYSLCWPEFGDISIKWGISIELPAVWWRMNEDVMQMKSGIELFELNLRFIPLLVRILEWNRIYLIGLACCLPTVSNFPSNIMLPPDLNWDDKWWKGCR